MQIKIEKINHIIEEHTIIGGRSGIIGEEINDLEAIEDLKLLSNSFSGTDEVVLSNKLKELKETMNYFIDSLRKHFEDEEQLFPELLGEPLARAIAKEHQQITGDITGLIAIGDNRGLDQLSHQRSPAIVMYIFQRIQTLRQMVKDHASREDVILQMILKGLQE
ncbi:hemerythrin domain-containing protein [Chloroflexota bacterium]